MRSPTTATKARHISMLTKSSRTALSCRRAKLPLKKSVEEKCTRIEDALLNGESVTDLL